MVRSRSLVSSQQGGHGAILIVFSTDAVYRYLLARYGFRPEELIHVKSPIRVGDVLLV